MEWDSNIISSRRSEQGSHKKKAKQKSKLKPFYSDSESLHKGCSKRVVEQQDAAEYLHAREKIPLRNFVCKVNFQREENKSCLEEIYKEPVTNRYEYKGKTMYDRNFKSKNTTERKAKSQASSRQHTDTELSQISLLTSDESKTYSQLYSETYEKQSRRAFTNKKPKWQKDQFKFLNKYFKSKDRAARWVANMGQPNIDDYTTETSNDIDIELESWQQSVKDGENCQDLVREQLKVIYVYQNDPFGFKRYMKESMEKLGEACNAARDQAEEILTEHTDKQFEDQVSHKSYQSTDDSYSLKTPNSKCLVDKSRIEVLHFEHCDVYHIRQPDKAYCHCKGRGSQGTFDLENHKENEIRKLSTDCTDQSDVNSSRVLLKHTKKRKTQRSGARKSLELKDNLSTVYSQQVEDCVIQESSNRAKERRVKGFKTCNMDSKNDAKEIICSTTAIYNESESRSSMRKSRKTSYSPNQSKSSSSTNSKSQSERLSNCDTYPIVEFDGYSINVNETDSNDDYYLSSKSVTADSSTINSTRSDSISANKRFQDRASSPIQIISSAVEVSNQMIEKLENYDKQGSFVAMPKRVRSTKSELENQQSQASIISEDKGVQCPSGDELEQAARNSSSAEQEIKTSDLDGFKGNTTELDDELLAGSKKDGSFLLNENQSSASIWSRSSYEPSRLFYRRTEPLEDENIYPFDDDDDSEPLTYQKHVSRLAARAFHYCMNYNEKVNSLRPALEVEISHKVQMIYDSEMQFQTYRRLKNREELLQKLNQQLQEQLTLIAPNFQ